MLATNPSAITPSIVVTWHPGSNRAMEKALGLPDSPLTKADSLNAVQLSVRPDGRVGSTRIVSERKPGDWQGLYA